MEALGSRRQDYSAIFELTAVVGLVDSICPSHSLL